MKTVVKYSEEELVELLKKQDKKGFDFLYENYSSALYGIVFKIVDKEGVAEDVLQEVFLKIWKNISNYDSTKGKLFTWLLNIARNTAIDTLRSKNTKNDLQNRKIENSVNEINRNYNTDINIDVIGLKDTVNKLKEEHKLLITMAYFGGYTQEEISKELNMPLGTVKTKIRSAIGQLKQFFKNN